MNANLLSNAVKSYDFLNHYDSLFAAADHQSESTEAEKDCGGWLGHDGEAEIVHSRITGQPDKAASGIFWSESGTPLALSS